MRPTNRFAWKRDGNGGKQLMQFWLYDGQELDASEANNPYAYIPTYKGSWEPVVDL